MQIPRGGAKCRPTDDWIAVCVQLRAQPARTEGGEPPARFCAARCARWRAHGRRARCTARAGQAAAARGAAASLRRGVCGCTAVLRGVRKARP
eukprot:2092815-Prymnesium_polylepis.1